MSPKNLPQSLRSVFGAFSQRPPEAKADAPRRPFFSPAAVGPSQTSGPYAFFLQRPTKAFDGSTEDPPWSFPEPGLVEWLSGVEIEHVEERVLDGVNGSFWVRVRNRDGELRSLLLTFDGIVRSPVYEAWGELYQLHSDRSDYLRRFLAAYEAAKGLGMEDLVAPVAPRHVNLVPYVSDAVRERVAGHYRIPPVKVDEEFGINSLIHILPLEAEAFPQKWATLAASDSDRWHASSDRLRHAIYRASVLEFLLGTDSTTLASALYNRSSDNVAHYGLNVSFPDPRAEAERYLSLRSEGWMRRPAVPTEKVERPSSPRQAAFLCLSRSIPDEQRGDYVMTLRQVAEGVGDEIALHLGMVLLDHKVPRDCVAGFYARLAFLAAYPEVIAVDPREFLRQCLVPMRQGENSEITQAVADFVTGLMSDLSKDPFDFNSFMQL